MKEKIKFKSIPSNKKIALLLIIVLLFSLKIPLLAKRVYGVVPVFNIRKYPNTQAPVISRIRHGRWLNIIKKEHEWYKVTLPNGKVGYVYHNLVSGIWIKVLKKGRKLHIMKDQQTVKTFTISLGFNPVDDKIKQGDGCTPEGRFYICQRESNPQPKESYGTRSMRISYPNIEDARRGLLNKIITKDQYNSIIKGINQGKMPNQRTPLGGSIKIHGGGVENDWTLGCMALGNENINYIYDYLPQKLAMVEIYHSKQRETLLNTRKYVNQQLLVACKKMLKKPCTYTSNATSIIPLTYPLGDLDTKQGVCADIVIRALRDLNIDLQALLYEDIILNPKRYPKILRPNYSIDHRRTRNLKIYLDHHTQVLTLKTPLEKPAEWKPGDIVLLDTGIQNGTIYDHIGIVSDQKRGGIWQVYNLWTIGDTMNEMDLLRGDYPTIVGHYRLHHPFYYDAVPGNNITP